MKKMWDVAWALAALVVAGLLGFSVSLMTATDPNPKEICDLIGDDTLPGQVEYRVFTTRWVGNEWVQIPLATGGC